MSLIFTIIQLIFYIWSAHIAITIAVWEVNGQSNYIGLRMYSLFICYGIHIMILISSIWFWGYIIGIIMFLLDFFSFINSIFGWIFSLSWLKYTHNSLFMDRIIGIKYFELFLTFILYLIFTIVYFINTSFQCAKSTSLYSFTFLIITIIISVICFLINIFAIQKRF